MRENQPSAPPRYSRDLEERVEAWARATIKPKRIPHVEGVVDTAERLARRYAPDEVARARLAGWIHDAAKHWPDEALLEYAETHELPITPAERDDPMLLHGRVGYAIADETFGLNDPALRDACAHHTTGAPGMSVLEKIVYLADLIEPGRDFPGVDRLRDAIERDLNVGMLASVEHLLRYLLNEHSLIDPRALLLRNELVKSGVRSPE
jgi:predicted HD superfamily hydrolase involved in NAD metabolism